jgi:L-lactate dehydrogenase complex protein LldF
MARKNSSSCYWEKKHERAITRTRPAIHALGRLPRRAKEVVENPFLRKSFRGAMDFLIDKRITQFPDKEELESLRTLGEHIRQYNLGKLPDILVQLETRLTENGVQVHWAETPDEANAIILGICQKHSAKLMVKGKSMVSEEIELNHAAEAAGIDAMESDMGEYIVQLAGEKPSHIIMPAIHKTKEEIAKLFYEKVPGIDYTDNVDALIQIGRNVLREKFLVADIGLSGVNLPSPKPARCAWSKTKAMAG